MQKNTFSVLQQKDLQVKKTSNLILKKKKTVHIFTSGHFKV